MLVRIRESCEKRHRDKSHLLPGLLLWPVIVLGGCGQSPQENPCVDTYPSIAPDVVTGPAGRISSIEPVQWLEDGVFRITVESGGDILVRPDGLPLPPIGAELEVRIFSASRNADPVAGCYCQVGTDLCVEEYAYR